MNTKKAWILDFYLQKYKWKKLNFLEFGWRFEGLKVWRVREWREEKFNGFLFLEVFEMSLKKKLYMEWGRREGGQPLMGPPHSSNIPFFIKMLAQNLISCNVFPVRDDFPLNATFDVNSIKMKYFIFVI